MAIIKPNNNTISAITALPAGVGGKVLQVVMASNDTQLSSTNASDTLLTKAITPTATSSSILCMITLWMGADTNSNGGIKLLRDSTAIITRSGGTAQDYNVEANQLASNSYVTMATNLNLQILDNPSTTSQITYKMQSTGIGSTRVFSMHENRRGSIVAYEVSA